MNKLTYLLTLASAGFLICSCDSTDIKEDTTAPGKLSVQSITPTSGGGIIYYNLPMIMIFYLYIIKTQGDEVYRSL